MPRVLVCEDSRTQAVLPLRGKILNTESLATAKALDNQELKDLVETLGTGIRRLASFFRPRTTRARFIGMSRFCPSA